MKSNSEMRREARSALRGKWFWRLLASGLALQSIGYVANTAVVKAFNSMSITTVGDFLAAKINAAQQGLAYSLPTTKAYCWMAAGFCFQMFVMYIFGAIFAFGFARLLLKMGNDDSRWFVDSFSGFARPVELAWLLFLMNLLISLAALPGALIGGVAAGAAYLLRPLHSLAALGITAIVIVSGAVAVVGVLRATYAYRQAWFIKNELPDASAGKCLRDSRRMMKGHKFQAFCLDISYAGWMLLMGGIFAASGMFGVIAQNGVAMGLASVVSFLLGGLSFYILVKVILEIMVVRMVFYRALPKAGESAEGEV